MSLTTVLAMLLARTLFPALSVADEMPRGEVIDKVTCRAEPAQSYALFLPSRYDARRQWPVLFCFDPAARGRIPVALFRDAAEQYGYIVAGSNNSRNGTGGQGPESMRAMWGDVQSRFNIDRARVFAGGMSGGARLVCGFAQQSDFLAGVVAFAAGFPGARVPGRVPHLFFGAAGVDDFNLGEMRQLEGELEQVGATTRIVTFAGGHGWPPVSTCTQAIEWLELQAMKAGTRQRDDDFIDRVFAEQLRAIRTAEAAGSLGDAYLLTKGLAADFTGLREVARYQARAAELGASREVKKYIQDEKDQQAEQRRRQSALLARWNERSAPPDGSPSFDEMLSDLRRQSNATTDSRQRRVARRVLDGIFVNAYEQGRGFLEQKNYPACLNTFELALAIYPHRPQLLYDLSSAYALAGERKDALDALKEAAKYGFRDAAAIAANPAFDSLRDDRRMKKIVAEMRGN